MKGTILMLGFLGTLLITWLCLSTLTYLCMESGTFREAATSGGIGFFMVVLGWIPSLIVCIDLEEKLSKA